VIVPAVESVAQAQQIVHAARYPPIGHRGAAPVVRAAKYGVRPWDDYLRESNEERLMLASIESTNALEASVAMLDVEGLDGVVLNPLSIALETGGSSAAPADLSGIAGTLAAARERGRIAAAVVSQIDDAVAWAQAGCGLVILESDVSACARAMADARISLGQAAGSVR
jgi:2-keto-3-deoxy-L-rhamnonate aldolase RhmA